MNNKNISKKIARIFGMTTFIILRIKGINNVLQIVLGFIYLIACIFFSIESIRNAKENTLEEMNKNLKILDWAIYVSFATILILLFI